MGAGAGAYFWRSVGGLFTRTDVVLDPAGGGALNVLMIGSDSREDIDDPEDIQRFGTPGGRRADTIILAQVVPSERRGVLLHFPRDLWVDIPDHGRGKINSAYQYGPQAVIDSVQTVTGVPVNHYMEIDLRGFRSMVDAMGGLDICLSEPLYDSQLNFRLEEGHNHLDGHSALSFVRARYATPDGDFGRIRRQQQFFKAVIAKVGRPSVLANPLRLNELGRAFASNVTVDQYFQLDDMIRFALQVRRVGPDQLETLSVPGRSGAAGGQSVVFLDESEASPIFQALQEARDPTPTPEPPPPGAPAPEAPAPPPEDVPAEEAPAPTCA